MAWIQNLLQIETIPLLETTLSFRHQKHLVIMNNIANAETPYYKRQTLPEEEFQKALEEAIRERKELHPTKFVMRPSGEIRYYDGYYPQCRILEGMEAGPERHDENSVVIEKEMADLSKNGLMITMCQRLLKKKLESLINAAAGRVA